MATQAEPVTDALFQALSRPEPDPKVVTLPSRKSVN